MIESPYEQPIPARQRHHHAFYRGRLFGMLAFAFMQGSRSSVNWVQKEKDNAAATSSTDCSNAVNLAVKRLEARGCGALISYNTDGSNSAAGAPADGSCSIYHINGGGVKNCGAAAPSCSQAELQALANGDSCSGVIYVGESSGRRFYTNAADIGPYTFDNGSGAVDNQPANDAFDGEANTDVLVAAGGPAAPMPQRMPVERWDRNGFCRRSISCALCTTIKMSVNWTGLLQMADTIGRLGIQAAAMPLSLIS